MNAAPSVAESCAISEEERRCLLHSRTEIAFLLRGIMKHKALITAYFNEGREFILTSIVGFDTARETVLLDLGPDEELNSRLMESRQILFTTTHEQVKIKFSAPRATRVTYQGHAAFQVAVPRQLMRMQRRDYYRIATGIVNPLKCRISLPAKDSVAAEVTLLDISCGGVALIDQHHAIDLEPGNAYPDCRIALPDLGTVSTGVLVCNTFEVTLRNGLACKRSGCQFIGIQEGERGVIQRYITRLERELSHKGGR